MILLQVTEKMLLRDCDVFFFSQQGDIIDDTEVPDGDTVRQRKVETARSSQKDGDEDQDSQDSGSSEMNKESDKKKDL